MMIIYGEFGIGKREHAERLREAFGCKRVLDKWELNSEVWPGDLIISDCPYAPNAQPGVRILHFYEAMHEAKLGHRLLIHGFYGDPKGAFADWLRKACYCDRVLEGNPWNGWRPPLPLDVAELVFTREYPENRPMFVRIVSFEDVLCGIGMSQPRRWFCSWVNRCRRWQYATQFFTSPISDSGLK
jgi:hypothetical protein